MTLQEVQGCSSLQECKINSDVFERAKTSNISINSEQNILSLPQQPSIVAGLVAEMVSQQRIAYPAALPKILSVALLCALGASAAAVAPAPAGSPVSYTDRFSQQPLLQFPGGTYKASDTDTFPVSTSTAGASPPEFYIATDTFAGEVERCP